MTASAAARRFRADREEEWRRLEALLTTVEKKSARALSDHDLLELPLLYRSALSSLSVARETSLDLELVTYLEGLCARAYFFVYGVRSSAWTRLKRFFRDDWPLAVRSIWRETLVACLLLLFGAVVGFLLVQNDPAWFGSFVPAELAGGRDFTSSAASLRSTLYDGGGKNQMLEAFAAFLFSHNSRVAIFCFALGFAFGLPTAMLLVYNGLTLGAFVALFSSRGLGLELGGWLFIHGTTELFAIILAGAAGLRIGWAVVFPGERARLQAASHAGRTSAVAMSGVVLMLLAAGLLEGVGRQEITSDLARYGIGSAALIIWLLYYYAPRSPLHG
ncbi:MAG TPA: stage II sporulation protein M [Allosphingosinicella sp.]|jgi:uncharacterized membrane protein SpoIIM required for sporulation|uniref:stage II sporulation protein M n=1 Tax=Allosphingosinicella sp. TaxID=2823234 RepID=UPI002F29CFAE